MANEITLNLKMSVVKGFLDHTNNPGSQTVTMNGTTAVGGVTAIGTATTGTILTMGSVSSAGYAYFRNTDATNYVELGTGTTQIVSFMKLKAGESAILRLGINAPMARANTAAVNLQSFILSD